MTIARKDIVAEREEGVYHCVSRCPRRVTRNASATCGVLEATIPRPRPEILVANVGAAEKGHGRHDACGSSALYELAHSW